MPALVEFRNQRQETAAQSRYTIPMFSPRPLAWLVSVHVFVLAASMPLAAHAGILSLLRDTISTSVPSADARHVIEFTLTNPVPASGFIRITPEADAVNIPAGLAISDIDLAIATSSSYVSGSIAATADASQYGLSISPGTSGSLLFQLPSGESLSAGTHLRVTIGAGAIAGTVGSTTIANSATPGSYRIRFLTEDSGHAEVDNGATMIAIVTPVGVSLHPLALAPVRFNGLPSGTIAAGSSVVELSLQTADYARCRYSTDPGIPFASMTNTFSPTGLASTFWTDVSGLQDNTTYTYYVRCTSSQNVPNDDDYVITFSLAPTPYSNTSVAGSGIIGSGGAGDYPNGSASLYLANVTLNGYTAPGSTVRILKDGLIVKSTQAKQDGSFRGDITGLERGVYTFLVSSIDTSARQSGSVPTTITLDSGTNNSVTDLIVPPTFSAATSSVGLRDDVRIDGMAVPSSSIDLRIDPPGGGVSQHFVATSSAAGAWSLTITGGTLAKGTYRLLARAKMSETRISGYGSAYALGVGEVPSLAAASGMRSDLNHDGKVSLVDFSILLTSWGTDGIGDINQDGTTNLSDFSILLFDWTG